MSAKFPRGGGEQGHFWPAVYLWSKTMEARLQERQIIEYGKINMAKLNLDMGQSRKKGKLLMFQEEQQQESISAG